jgi:hypothetical protein
MKMGLTNQRQEVLESSVCNLEGEGVVLLLEIVVVSFSGHWFLENTISSWQQKVLNELLVKDSTDDGHSTKRTWWGNVTAFLTRDDVFDKKGVKSRSVVSSKSEGEDDDGNRIQFPGLSFLLLVIFYLVFDVVSFTSSFRERSKIYVHVAQVHSVFKIEKNKKTEVQEDPKTRKQNKG